MHSSTRPLHLQVCPWYNLITAFNQGHLFPAAPVCCGDELVGPSMPEVDAIRSSSSKSPSSSSSSTACTGGRPWPRPRPASSCASTAPQPHALGPPTFLLNDSQKCLSSSPSKNKAKAYSEWLRPTAHVIHWTLRCHLDVLKTKSTWCKKGFLTMHSLTGSLLRH